MREILGRGIDDKSDKKINISEMQINPNSKNKLIKTFTDRENELLEQIALEQANSENYKEKFKKIRTYARKVRNLVLDYYPIYEEILGLLTKELDLFLEGVENESVLQFLEFEVKFFRERNKKLEFDFKRRKDGYKGNKNFSDIKHVN